MKVLQLGVIVGTVASREFFGVQAVTHRQAQVLVCDRFLRVGELLHRRCDDQDLTLPELAEMLLEVSQLLTAKPSPVPTVDEQYRPLLRREA